MRAVYTTSDAKARKKSPRERSDGVGEPPAIARVFQSGNSQAVRLPKQFKLRSKQVQVFRRGTDIVLRERSMKLCELLADLPALTDDAFPDEIPDAPPEPIKGF